MRLQCHPGFNVINTLLHIKEAVRDLNSDIDCRIFNVCTDVNACDCTRGGGYAHVRECALKIDSGRKIPCLTGESNLRRQRASPMLYQLNYSPTRRGCTQPALYGYEIDGEGQFCLIDDIRVSSRSLAQPCICRLTANS